MESQEAELAAAADTIEKLHAEVEKQKVALQAELTAAREEVAAAKA